MLALPPGTYQHWLLPEGGSTTIRTLPTDLADPAPSPFIGKRIVKLPFDAGIAGVTDAPAYVALVCPTTFGQVSPIDEATRRMWRDPDPDVVQEARRRWRQEFFLSWGLVVANPVAHPEPLPAVIINNFTKALFENQVRPPYLDVRLPFSPADPDEGRDFILRKTRSGQYPTYTSSGYDYTPRALTDKERADAVQHGLGNAKLQALLGTPTTSSELAQMQGMIEDSLNDVPFDPAKYPSFRAWPVDKVSSAGSVSPSAASPRTNGSGRAANLRKLVPVTAEQQEAAAETMTALRARNSVTISP